MSGELRPCDLVVFAPHPDDGELNCGGLLLMSARQGWRTAIVEMTRGEMGTRGTPEIRARECEAAAAVLGLTVRSNLGLPDCAVRDSDEGRHKVVGALRALRPRVVVAPPPRSDHHADHLGTADVVQKSIYLSGIAKYGPALPPYRPPALINYMGSRLEKPAMVVDVTQVIEERRKAILCHASQIGPLAPGDPELRIAHPDFLQVIDARLRHFGWMIGVTYGEAYTVESSIPVADMVALFGVEGRKPR